MKKTRALIAVIVGAGMATVAFSQNYPPAQQQYPPQGQQQPYPQDQQQYPQQQQYPPQQQPYPQQGQPQYPQQYPQGQYPPAQTGQYPQVGPGQAPVFPPQQLEQMVASIALYPDGLLAHVLTAATVYQQIPEAAGWANQHAYLHGEQLAAAIREDNLPWDVSVLSLIPFPQVLGTMAQNMQWTEQLGDAVLAQRPDVMDAIQRLRARASQDGYFRDPQFNRYERVVVAGPGLYQIDPVGPDYYVPYYNPQIFFAPPRPGFFVGFSFGPAVSIGGFFSPWGWGPGVGLGWREHSIIVGGSPWNRGWVDRERFNRPVPFHDNGRPESHGYVPQRRDGGPRPEQHRDEHRDNREHH
jgi:hypothetical protein